MKGASELLPRTGRRTIAAVRGVAEAGFGVGEASDEKPTVLIGALQRLVGGTTTTTFLAVSQTLSETFS